MQNTDNMLDTGLVGAGKLCQVPLSLTELETKLSLGVLRSDRPDNDGERFLRVLSEISRSPDQAVTDNQHVFLTNDYPPTLGWVIPAERCLTHRPYRKHAEQPC